MSVYRRTGERERHRAVAIPYRFCAELPCACLPRRERAEEAHARTRPSELRPSGTGNRFLTSSSSHFAFAAIAAVAFNIIFIMRQKRPSERATDADGRDEARQERRGQGRVRTGLPPAHSLARFTDEDGREGPREKIEMTSDVKSWKEALHCSQAVKLCRLHLASLVAEAWEGGRGSS